MRSECHDAGAREGCGRTISSVIRGAHQAKAAYRLLDSPSTTHAAVIHTHCESVRQLLDEPGTTLLIEDTTAIAYPGLKQASGLGPIGEDFTRGYWLHITGGAMDTRCVARRRALVYAFGNPASAPLG